MALKISMTVRERGTFADRSRCVKAEMKCPVVQKAVERGEAELLVDRLGGLSPLSASSITRGTGYPNALPAKATGFPWYFCDDPWQVQGSLIAYDGHNDSPFSRVQDKGASCLFAPSARLSVESLQLVGRARERRGKLQRRMIVERCGWRTALRPRAFQAGGDEIPLLPRNFLN
jgi:hypothetical protein